MRQTISPVLIQRQRHRHQRQSMWVMSSPLLLDAFVLALAVKDEKALLPSKETPVMLNRRPKSSSPPPSFGPWTPCLESRLQVLVARAVPSGRGWRWRRRAEVVTGGRRSREGSRATAPRRGQRDEDLDVAAAPCYSATAASLLDSSGLFERPTEQIPTRP